MKVSFPGELQIKRNVQKQKEIVMRRVKDFFIAPVAILSAAFCLVNSNANASSCDFESPCEAGVVCRVTEKKPYKKLYKTLAPYVDEFETLVNALLLAPNNAAATLAYDALYAASIALSSTISDGRVLVALSDGTVVVDTAQAIDLGCSGQCNNCGCTSTNTNTAPAYPCPNPVLANGYCHYATKTVNENYNTRVAVINANQWRCGVGAETRFNTSSRLPEAFVAIRMGDYLDCTGVVMISQLQSSSN